MAVKINVKNYKVESKRSQNYASMLDGHVGGLNSIPGRGMLLGLSVLQSFSLQGLTVPVLKDLINICLELATKGPYSMLRICYAISYYLTLLDNRPKS